MHFIGDFEVTSGKLVVSDPCYERGLSGAAGILNNVKNGKWKGSVVLSDEGAWGQRIAELVVNHIDHEGESECISEVQDFGVGVDSGQAGFFCDSVYPKGDVGEYGEIDTFYGRACLATDDFIGAGIVDGKSIVSSSGFGDGVYTCYVKRKNKKITGAKIVFIEDEPEEEEEEEDPNGF